VVDPSVSRGLVLVVDDSPEMRVLIGDVLTDDGFEVVAASSGGRALSLMAERRPDLVITDLMMPGMSGFTLRGEMLRRADLARVPVVVLSAFWQRPSETLDVVDVIAKPLDIDRLLDVVKRAVDGAGAGGTDADGADGDGVAAMRKVAGRGDSNGRRRDAGRIKQKA
jgi:two-component system sensor histidine kinase/response regulator